MTHATAQPATRITITADRCWDGVGDAPSGPVAVIVEGSQITAVGTPGSLPSTDQQIRLGDRTLMPGFIDCHVHFVNEQQNQESIAYQTLEALPGMRALLKAGFTTVRDLGGADRPINVALKRAVDEGVITGPRLIVAPNIISARGGHGDKSPDLAERYGLEVGALADGPDQLQRRVRQQLRAGADWIKFAASGGFSSPVDDPTQVAFTAEEMCTIVQTARDCGIPCAAHAYNDESITRALGAGVRSIEHGSLASPQTLAHIARSGTYLVPTRYTAVYYTQRLDDEDFWAGKSDALRDKCSQHVEQLQECAHHLRDAEVSIAFGTDSGMFPNGENWREFAALLDVGLTPLRALRAATTVAADLLNRPGLGRIAPGATADLIALDGDPFTDIEATGRVDFVMKEGIVHHDETYASSTENLRFAPLPVDRAGTPDGRSTTLNQ